MGTALSGEAFTGGACPTCGQNLPFEQLKVKTEAFEESKRKRLSGIETKVAQLKQDKQNDITRLADLEKEAAERTGRIDALKAEIQKAQSTVSGPVSDMASYAEKIAAFNEKIVVLQNEYIQIGQSSAAVRDSVRSKLNAVNNQLRLTRGEIAKEAVKEQVERRVSELHEL